MTAQRRNENTSFYYCRSGHFSKAGAAVLSPVSRLKILFFLTALLAATGCRKEKTKSDGSIPVPSDAVIYTVRHGSLPLEQSGKIEAKDINYVTGEYWGKLEWKIEKHSEVKAGDVVMRQETTDYEDRYQSQRQSYESQNNELLQKLREISEAEESSREEMGTALDSEEVTALRFSGALFAPEPLNIEDSLYSLRLTKAHFEAARDELKELQPLVDKGYVSVRELLFKAVDKRVKQLQLEKSWRNFLAVLAGRSDPDRGIAALNWLEADLRTNVKRLEARQRMVGLRSSLGGLYGNRSWSYDHMMRSKRRIDAAVIRAPADGTVVYAKDWRGNEIELGRWVGPGMAALYIIDRNKLKVRTEIPEFYVNELHVGRTRCEIFTKPDEQGSKFSGTVLWIDQWARDKNNVPGEAPDKKKGLSGVRVFNVEVDIENADSKILNQGQIVWVQFPVASRSDVVYAPKPALFREKGWWYAWKLVVTPGEKRAVKTRVTLGEVAGRKVIILDGLQPGDLIMHPLRKEEKE